MSGWEPGFAEATAPTPRALYHLDKVHQSACRGQIEPFCASDVSLRALQVSGLAFGFLEDPLCKVFALSKLLRKTPCSGLEPGKPLFQRFSWLRFFCIVKFTLFFAAFALKIERLRRRRLFWRRRRNFLDLSVGEPGKPLFRPQKTPCAAFCSPRGKPLVQHFDPLFSLKKVKKGFIQPQISALYINATRG